MLVHTLSVTAGLASLFLYLSAFFFPRLHKKDDFFWSGLGLFYSLSLWICVEEVTEGLLLGQLCILILVLSFGWQNFRLRNTMINLEHQTDFTEFSFLGWIQRLLKRQSFFSTVSSNKNKKPGFNYRKKELNLEKKNTIENEDIGISKETQNKILLDLDEEKISNTENKSFSFKSLFPFSK
ncbi:MAG: Ycf66 family protein [Candidatus Atelocyanobacterium thalassa]